MGSTSDEVSVLQTKMKPTYFPIMFQAPLTCVKNGRHWLLHAGIGPVPGNYELLHSIVELLYFS